MKTGERGDFRGRGKGLLVQAGGGGEGGREGELLERGAATTLAAVEADSQDRKQGRNVFAHRREECAGGEQSRGELEQAPAEEKQKGWFGSKDSHSKPR